MDLVTINSMNSVITKDLHSLFLNYAKDIFLVALRVLHGIRMVALEEIKKRIYSPLLTLMDGVLLSVLFEEGMINYGLCIMDVDMGLFLENKI